MEGGDPVSHVDELHLGHDARWRRSGPLPIPTQRTGTLVRSSQPIPYAKAWTLQKQLQQDRIAERQGDVLLLLEHLPVYTLGRTTQPAHWELRGRGSPSYRRKPPVRRSGRIDHLPWTGADRGLSRTQAVALLLRA